MCQNDAFKRQVEEIGLQASEMEAESNADTKSMYNLHLVCFVWFGLIWELKSYRLIVKQNELRCTCLAGAESDEEKEATLGAALLVLEDEASRLQQRYVHAMSAHTCFSFCMFCMFS